MRGLTDLSQGAQAACESTVSLLRRVDRSVCPRIFAQRAGGAATVNEAIFDLSTRMAPVSIKTGTWERVP